MLHLIMMHAQAKSDLQRKLFIDIALCTSGSGYELTLKTLTQSGQNPDTNTTYHITDQ